MSGHCSSPTRTARLLNAGFDIKTVEEAGRWKKLAIVDETYGHLEQRGAHDAMLSVGGLTATDLKPRIGQAKKEAVPVKERPKSREETPKKGYEVRTTPSHPRSVCRIAAHPLQDLHILCDNFDQASRVHRIEPSTTCINTFFPDFDGLLGAGRATGAVSRIMHI